MFDQQQIPGRKTRYLIFAIIVCMLSSIFEACYCQAQTSQDSLLELLKYDAQSAFFQKKYQTAIRKWQQFLMLDKQRKDTLDIAQIYINIGLSYSRISDFSKAFDSYNQAQVLYEKMGYTTGIIHSLRYAASLYTQIADYGNALRKFLKAYELAPNAADSPFRSSIIAAIGNTYLKLNDFDRARHYFYQVLEIKRDKENLTGQGQVIAQLGVLNFYEGYFDSALIQFKHAIRIQEKIGDHFGLKTSYLNLGLLYYTRNQLKSAMTYFRKALASQKAVDDLESQPATLLRMSDISYHRQQFGQAFSWCSQALQKAKQLGNPLDQAESLRKMGLIKFTQNQFHDAMKYMESALALALDANSPEEIWKVYLGIGVIKEKQKLFLEASESFKHALSYIELTTPRRRLFSEPKEFIHNKLDTYFKAINSLLQLHEKFPDQDYLTQAFETAERLSARRLHDALYRLFPKDQDRDIRENLTLIKALQLQKEAFEKILLNEKIKPTLSQNVWKMLSLRNYITKTQQNIHRLEQAVFKTHPDYRLLFTTPSAMLDSIRTHLAANQVLIKYQILPEKLLIFIVTARQIKYKDIGLSEPKFFEMLHEFRSALNLSTAFKALPIELKSERASHLAKLNQKFSDYLLAYVCDETTPEQELLIIPDQYLSFFPFVILTAPSSDGRPIYLLESRTIRFFNSGAHLLAAKKFNLRNSDHALILASNDTSLQDDRNEGVNIANGLKKSAIACDIYDTDVSDWSRRAYKIIHVALSGEWQGESIENSYFKLAAKKTLRTQPEIFLSEWFGIRASDSAFVFLSSFNANLSERQTDQGLLSLIEVWKMMKAASILVSLWETPIESRKLLVSEFYKRLQSGQSPAQALCMAQLSMIKSKQFADPFYWAGFQVYGH